MKKVIYCLLFTAYCLLFSSSVHASYVLPYPSYMPGNKIYRISRIFDRLKNYWYFGNLAQVKYHLGLSDKYLVEAKTLMEYNQYLLASDALIRSDKEFVQVPGFIHDAKNDGIDITNIKNIVTEAAKKHNEVLTAVQRIVPAEFVWTPEKGKPTELNIHSSIQTSTELRNSVISQLEPN